MGWCYDYKQKDYKKQHEYNKGYEKKEYEEKEEKGYGKNEKRRDCK